MIRLIII